MADSNRTRARACAVCQATFEYPVGRGADRKHCSVACRSKQRIEFRHRRRALGLPCSTPGCSKPVDRMGPRQCEACYACFRKHGTTARPPSKRRGFAISTAGYRLVFRPNHPMAQANGMALEHRVVFYDSVLGIPQPCAWCGCDLAWADTVVDHLNARRTENGTGNLVASCNDCNLTRGGLAFFAVRLTDAGFDRMIETLSLLRRQYKTGFSGKVI